MNARPGARAARPVDTALRRIEAAKVRLLSHPTRGLPYYGAAVSSLAPTRPSTELATLSVDTRWRVHANPVWVNSVHIDALCSLLAHELTHLLRDHAGRGRLVASTPRQVKLWRDAACVEVNDDLHPCPGTASGTASSDGLGLRPNRAAERHYQDLLATDPADPEPGTGSDTPVTEASSGEGDNPEPACREPGDHDCGSAADGHARPWEPRNGGSDTGTVTGSEPEDGLDRLGADMVRRQVAEDIRATAAAQRGTIPAGLRAWAEAALEPGVDWQSVLRAHIRRSVAVTSGRDDYSYRRPGRRNTGGDIILPCMVAPDPEVTIVLDTSASMTGEPLARALTEIKGLLRGLGLAEASLIQVDAAVQHTARIRTVDDTLIAGGGGTDMTVGIEQAVSTPPRPSVVVVLTDGYTDWPQTPPPVPVVACLVGDDTRCAPQPPPHITAIHISDLARREPRSNTGAPRPHRTGGHT